MWQRVALLLMLMAFASCASLPRLDTPPAYATAVVPVGFPAAVRVTGVDWRMEAPPEQIFGRLQAAATDGSFDVLACRRVRAAGTSMS